MSPTELVARPSETTPRPAHRRRARRHGGPIAQLARGTPFLWLTGAGLAVCLCMVGALLVLVLTQGVATFWPAALERIELVDGRAFLGEVERVEDYRPGPDVFEALTPEMRARAEDAVRLRDGLARRRLLRRDNFELTNEHYLWIKDFEIARTSRPEWALLLERMSWGRFYGEPRALLLDGKPVADEPARVVELLGEELAVVSARRAEQHALETHEMGALNTRIEDSRLELRALELARGKDSAEWRADDARHRELEAQAREEIAGLRQRIDELGKENARHELELATAEGGVQRLPLSEIVRAVPANRLGFFGRLGVYLARWREFLFDEPRASNSEGGVFPAIFGTVTMTLLMTLLVVPIGVLAALYLREYARAGWIVSAVRIAINNLAGVPSIVYGVFGLGFFCYGIGGFIDRTFFAAKLPNPTFGTGGLLWAALTLALLTLPVVIVATEEALAAVPNSMREGSFACGASKWQTIRRIVLPRALPGITTGTILAMARGAGEVAPLMLVGAVRLAADLPVDGTFPFVHAQRSFMHLGFHIYDLGFHSPNSEAARPMVYTTTLLLIAIVVTLNLAAFAVRARLHRRFRGSHL